LQTAYWNATSDDERYECIAQLLFDESDGTFKVFSDAVQRGNERESRRLRTDAVWWFGRRLAAGRPGKWAESISLWTQDSKRVSLQLEVEVGSDGRLQSCAYDLHLDGQRIGGEGLFWGSPNIR
jgi:hypothetical protein